MVSLAVVWCVSVDVKVGRLRYAQPVFSPEFLQNTLSTFPGIHWLKVADTCYYYPEDRGDADSLRLGKQMA